MAQDSATILKELSVLSSNMDALVRELKEQNKTTAENTKGINDLVTQIKENPISKTQKPVDQKESPTKLFENLVSSFSKEISKSNEILQKNLDKQMGSSLKDLAKNVFKPAEVKPNPNLDFFKALGLDKLPQLKDGGQIQKDGVAIVGEDGPEIVKLKKDQNVISKNDQELLEAMKQEMERDRQKRLNPEIQDLSNPSPQGRLADIKKKKLLENTSDLVTGSQNLTDYVTNSFGVKVPKKEIDKRRDKLLREDQAYYEQEPAELEEDIKSFIENYRETLDFSKFLNSKPENQEKLKSIKEQPAANPAEELSQRDKRKKDGEEKKAEKEKNREEKKAGNEKLESVVTPTKPKLLESLKSKGKEFGSNLKQSFLSKVDSTKQTLSEKTPPDELEMYASVSQRMQKLSKDMSESMEMKKETPSLKKVEEEKSKPKSTPASSLPQQQAIESATPKVTETQTSPSKIQENKKEKKETSETLPHQEIKEIKALLAGIYKALSGPLRIANDTPFRPNSNII
jgi:hypothetical protein